MGLNLVNITVPVQNGTSTHGDPHSLCQPAKWTDIAIFICVNYVAHAATAIKFPGESSMSVGHAMLLALLVPVSGMIRGLNSIARRAIFQSNPLQTACQAGALCMVVRTKDWKPQNLEKSCCVARRGPQGRSSPNTKITSSIEIYRPIWTFENSQSWFYPEITSFLIRPKRKIHGYHELVPGYALAHIQHAATVEPLYGLHSKTAQITVAASYSITKAIIALVQGFYASVTLYRASRSGIKNYGFSAFELTVAPYLVMSVVNLCGTLLTPTYDALYMIRSPIMEEAIQRGATFDGVIGSLPQQHTEADCSEKDMLSGCFETCQSQPTGRSYSSSGPSRGDTGAMNTDQHDHEANRGEGLVDGPSSSPPIQFRFRKSNVSCTGASTTTSNPDHRHDQERGEYALRSISANPSSSSEGGTIPICQTQTADSDPAPTLLVPCCPEFANTNHPRNESSGNFESAFRSKGGYWRLFHPDKRRYFGKLLVCMAGLLVSSSSILIIGATSGFHSTGGGNNAVNDKVFVCWLISSIILGSVCGGDIYDSFDTTSSTTNKGIKLRPVHVLCIIGLITGGMLFSLVIRDMSDWGACIPIN